MPTDLHPWLLAWLLVLAGIACLSLTACETRKGPGAGMQRPRTATEIARIPDLDVAAPAVIHTATFALG